MSPFSELAELEKRLAETSAAGPGDAFRARVLSDVRRDLTRDRRRANWDFLAVTAAIVALCVNLTISAVNVTTFGFERIDSPAFQVTRFSRDALSFEETGEFSLRTIRIRMENPHGIYSPLD